jgi:hypothetical protein
MNMKTMQVMLTAASQREKASDMVAAMAPLMKPAGDPRHDRLFEVLLLKMMKERGGGVEDMMAVLEKGMELASGKEPDPLASVGTELVKLIARGMDQPAGVPGRPALMVGKSPTPAAPIRELSADQQQAIGALQSLVQEVAPLFARVSRSGLANVDVYAEVLCEAVERRPELDAHLDEWFGDPAYPAMVLGLFAEVDQTWLAAVLLRVRELLTEEDAETRAVDQGDRAVVAGRSGDDTDPRRDAAVRERGVDGTGGPESGGAAHARVRTEP